MSNLKCTKHGRRVSVSTNKWNDTITIKHKTGEIDRCDSSAFVINGNSYTAAQIVSRAS